MRNAHLLRRDRINTTTYGLNSIAFIGLSLYNDICNEVNLNVIQYKGIIKDHYGFFWWKCICMILLEFFGFINKTICKMLLMWICDFFLLIIYLLRIWMDLFILYERLLLVINIVRRSRTCKRSVTQWSTIILSSFKESDMVWRDRTPMNGW